MRVGEQAAVSIFGLLYESRRNAFFAILRASFALMLIYYGLAKAPVLCTGFYKKELH
jgi:hypothetical protein